MQASLLRVCIKGRRLATYLALLPSLATLTILQRKKKIYAMSELELCLLVCLKTLVFSSFSHRINWKTLCQGSYLICP